VAKWSPLDPCPDHPSRAVRPPGVTLQTALQHISGPAFYECRWRCPQMTEQDRSRGLVVFRMARLADHIPRRRQTSHPLLCPIRQPRTRRAALRGTGTPEARGGAAQDRDDVVERSVDRFVYSCPAAFADLLEDLVLVQAVSGEERLGQSLGRLHVTAGRRASRRTPVRRRYLSCDGTPRGLEASRIPCGNGDYPRA